MNFNKVKKLMTLMIILIFLVTTSSCVKTNINQELQNKINDSNIMQSNVLIVKEVYNTINQSVSSISYTYGFSGGIIKRNNDRYYILTSYHPIEGIIDENLFILLWDEPRYNDLKSEEKKGLSTYYESKPTARIEYVNIKYDLAIISFQSDVVLPVLEINSLPPKFNENIATISNPKDRDRNYISFGKITSKSPVPFGDEKDDIQFGVIEHDAFISGGSSGSILINEDLKVVGINLGGTTNIFGKFIKGKAMPSNRIIDFINEASIW